MSEERKLKLSGSVLFILGALCTIIASLIQSRPIVVALVYAAIILFVVGYILIFSIVFIGFQEERDEDEM